MSLGFCRVCDSFGGVHFPKDRGNLLPAFSTPSALSRLNFRVDGLQFTSCVADFHLPVDASLHCVNIS